MDADVAKILEHSKKLTKKFEEILPIFDRIFKSPSEQQKDFGKKAFPDEFFEEIKKLDFSPMSLGIQAALSKLDPQLTEEFFKNDPQVQEDRGKSITLTKTTETKYPQDQGNRGKSITVTTTMETEYPQVQGNRGKSKKVVKTTTTTEYPQVQGKRGKSKKVVKTTTTK